MQNRNSVQIVHPDAMVDYFVGLFCVFIMDLHALQSEMPIHTPTGDCYNYTQI